MMPGKLHGFAATALQPVTPLLRWIEGRLLCAKPSSSESHPLLFVLGPPRSGTTVTFQCLTHYLDVTYPTHLTALFPRTPAFGLWVSDKFYGGRPHHAFRSVHGFSVGDGGRGPSEWEPLFRWYVYPNLPGTHPKTRVPKIKSIHHLELLAAYVDRYARKPLVVKTLGAALHIEGLAAALPRAMFLYVQRSAIDTARSIYRAKRREGKDPDVLWYVQPPSLKGRRFTTEAHQIAAQVRTIHELVMENFSRLGGARTLVLQYEELCRSPVQELVRVAHWLGPTVRRRNGARLPALHAAPASPLSDACLDEVLREELG